MTAPKGRQGRPAKPTNLKILHGDRSDRINVTEPLPGRGDVVPPEWLDALARQTWDRLAPDMIAKGVLTPWDAEAFAVLCDAVARHSEAAQQVVSRGVLVQGERGQVKNPAAQIVRDYAAVIISYGSRFGITPSDRASLSMPDESDVRGAEQLLS